MSLRLLIETEWRWRKRLRKQENKKDRKNKAVGGYCKRMSRFQRQQKKKTFFYFKSIRKKSDTYTAQAYKSFMNCSVYTSGVWIAAICVGRAVNLRTTRMRAG